MADWFRSWHGAPTDPKWLLIGQRAGVAPAIVSAIFWALCDHASQQEDRGSVENFDVETYAVFGGLDEGQVRAVIVALTEKGLISDGRLSAWERRQPKREDSSTERVRAHRERRRAVTDTTGAGVTPRNAGERDETQRNAPDTETETETEFLSAADDPPHPERRKRRRKPDPWFDQFTTVFELNPALLNDVERGRINKACGLVRESKGRPEEIPIAAERYRARHPTWELTPLAIASNWNDLMRRGDRGAKRLEDEYPPFDVNGTYG